LATAQPLIMLKKGTNRGVVGDMLKGDVREPLAIKIQIVKSASKAARMILKIDDVVLASRKKDTKL
jgi:chaperonin GroEL (HSP60 family)